jgi:hypothetical protein
LDNAIVSNMQATLPIAGQTILAMTFEWVQYSTQTLRRGKMGLAYTKGGLVSQFTAHLQHWTESERGWGQRPDGYSLHLTAELAKQYVVEYNAKLPSGPAPDEYTFADGGAVEVEVSEKLHQMLQEKGGSMRFWQRELVVGQGRTGTRYARLPSEAH